MHHGGDVSRWPECWHSEAGGCRGAAELADFGELPVARCRLRGPTSPGRHGHHGLQDGRDAPLDELDCVWPDTLGGWQGSSHVARGPDCDLHTNGKQRGYHGTSGWSKSRINGYCHFHPVCVCPCAHSYVTDLLHVAIIFRMVPAGVVGLGELDWGFCTQGAGL